MTKGESAQLKAKEMSHKFKIKQFDTNEFIGIYLREFGETKQADFTRNINRK